ncbi:unnamed protein product, partial [Ectocarpus sp. 13 AM-2016]
MNVDGKGRCLDAFTVALSQAGEGKRWYVSTVELQLASREYCRACRSVTTLHVTVDNRTPRCLWADRDSRTRPGTHSSKKVCSSRVPIVRALRLTWMLPMEVLLNSANVELWKWSHGLLMEG